MLVNANAASGQFRRAPVHPLAVPEGSDEDVLEQHNVPFCILAALHFGGCQLSNPRGPHQLQHSRKAAFPTKDAKAREEREEGASLRKPRTLFP